MTWHDSISFGAEILDSLHVGYLVVHGLFVFISGAIWNQHKKTSKNTYKNPQKGSN